MEPETRTERSLASLIADVIRLMRRDFYSQTAGLGLTPALARLLYHVNRAPGSRQAELAARLHVSPVTLGRMIDRLVAREYVRRRPDPEDRRAVRVYVAPKGKPLIAKMTEVERTLSAHATRGLAARERAALRDLLERLYENLAGGTSRP